MQNTPILNRQIATFMKYGVFTIIILVPFYTFFSTWLGSNIGGLLILRAWKEFLLAALVIGASFMILKDTKLRQAIFKNKLVWLITLFAIWSLTSALILPTNAEATLLGLIIQLRPLLFFLVSAVVLFYTQVSETTLIKLITYPAIGVVAFGLLQLFVLPQDFLKHFGYQKNVTIPPYFTIDEQYNRIRIFSTLRGPNPLGTYLIAPVILLINRIKNLNTVMRYGLYAIPILVVLYGSHSRSAWLGLVAASVAYGWLVASRKWKLILIAVTCLGSVLTGTALYQYRQTNFVQDVILHDNPEEGGDTSSNQGRIDAFAEAKGDIVNSPIWGCGIGCAGPASVHNKNGAKISENFYIQTIQELGVVGLILLLAIHTVVGIRLLIKKTNFAYMWLAVFVGISVVSLLSHAWADDTITYLWWGIAGLLLGIAPKTTRL